MDRQRILQQLECFHPDRDDLRDPQWDELRLALENDPTLSAHRDRLYVADRKIALALQSGPSLTGLKERLLASLAAATPPTPLDETAIELAPSTQKQPRRWSRRTWSALATAAMVTMLAIPSAAWLTKRSPPESISKDELRLFVESWLRGSWNDPNAWTTKSRTAASRPVDRTVRATPVRWRKLPSELDSGMVLYDLAGVGKPTAILFVVQSPHLSSVSSVSPSRLPLSGRLKARVWRKGDLVYVLVVDEDGKSIDDYLRPTQVA